MSHEEPTPPQPPFAESAAAPAQEAQAAGAPAEDNATSSYWQRHEEWLARKQREEANRTPDGYFAEYRDVVPFSVINGVLPLGLDNAPEVVEQSFAAIAWGEPRAQMQIMTHTFNWSTQLNRALTGALDNPTLPESEDTFNRLSRVVWDMPVDLLSLPYSEVRVWAQKVMLLHPASELVDQKRIYDKRAFGVKTQMPAMERFTSLVRENIQAVIAELEHATNPDPVTLMTLIDTFEHRDEVNSANWQATMDKAASIPRATAVPLKLYDVMQESRRSARGMLDELFNAEYAMVEVWGKYLFDWDGVNRVLAAYPALESDMMRVRVVEALEDAAEQRLAGGLTAENFAAEGLAELIHADIYKNVSPAARPLDFFDDDNIPHVTYGDVSLPRTSAPVSTVAVLGASAENMTPEDFAAVLGRMQQAIYGKGSRSATTPNEWLLTLALLRKHPNEQVRNQTDAFIARQDFPNRAFQQIITGKKNGQIYLLGDKIRIDTNLSRGIVLASSQVETPPAQSQQRPSNAPVRPSAPGRTPGEPAAQQSNPSRPGPARGMQLTRNQRKKLRREQGAEADSTAKVAAAAGAAAAGEARPEIAPPLIVSDEAAIDKYAARLSPEDRAVVKQAIREHNQGGPRRLTPLRGRTGMGELRFKLRVNAVSGGIRVILTHLGGNQYEVNAIQHRGAVYKENIPL